MKKFIYFLIFLATVSVILLIAAFYWYQNAINFHNAGAKATVVFEVKAGENFTTIAENLANKGLLKELDAFVIYCKLNPDIVAKFQAGFFEISPRSSVIEIATILQKAQNKEGIKITIPEGLRYDEVANLLDKAFSTIPAAVKPGKSFSKLEFIKLVENPDGKFSGSTAEFLSLYKPAGKSLEGFLYPDTYFFNPDASVLEVTTKLINTLSEKISRDDLQVLEASKYSFYDTLILASLVEHESLSIDEEAVIANIITKRIESKIPTENFLQADSSLLYGAKNWKLDSQTLRSVANPFNTYMNAGLTPTPIGSPVLRSIQAVLYPKLNDYYYYLHDNAGTIHYSKTLAEHLNNIKKYL